MNKLKTELVEQRKSKFKGNIYHYSQVNFAYNSNKMEGGKLTEDETEEIFETDREYNEINILIRLMFKYNLSKFDFNQFINITFNIT